MSLVGIGKYSVFRDWPLAGQGDVAGIMVGTSGGFE